MDKKNCLAIHTPVSIRMAESLHCSLETVTALLIGYTPIHNKKLKKLSKKHCCQL